MPPARRGQHPRPRHPDDPGPAIPKSHDPGLVPEWARQTIAQIAREHPQNLAHHLDHIAEIDAARRRPAGHPPTPVPPLEARDFLHLAAIGAWQALASGRPAPGLDAAALEQAIDEAFTTTVGGCSPVDQLCGEWLELARQHGIVVDDEHGDLLPAVADAISHTVSAAIWFGITTGYLTLAGSYHIPCMLLTR